MFGQEFEVGSSGEILKLKFGQYFDADVWWAKVAKFSLLILQSGSNPRHLNSKAFLDCKGLHLNYMIII